MATINDLHVVINDLVGQAIGEDAIDTIDYSNLASLGDSIIQSGRNGTNDPIFGKFVDRIARLIVANRTYKSEFDYLYMDPIVWGAAIQKVHVECMDAQTSGKYLQGDTSTAAELSGQMQALPTVHVSLFTNFNAWEIMVTITEQQIRTGFNSEEELSAFIAGIFTALDTSMQKELESYARGTLATYMGELLVAQAAADSASETKRMAVNLIQQYYTETGQTVTAAAAWYNEGFLRWVTGFFKDEISLFTQLNVLRNADGFEKHTPAEYVRFLINTKFADNIQRFMQSNVYHDAFVTMPGYREVDYWQGLGNLSAADRTKIKGKLISTTTSGNVTTNNTVNKSNIVAVVFDPFAVGITVKEHDSVAVPLLRSHRTTYFEQFKQGGMIDLSEQGTVYYLEDLSEDPGNS